jgi:hypothetical protein
MGVEDRELYERTSDLMGQARIMTDSAAAVAREVARLNFPQRQFTPTRRVKSGNVFVTNCKTNCLSSGGRVAVQNVNRGIIETSLNGGLLAALFTMGCLRFSGARYLCAF